MKTDQEGYMRGKKAKGCLMEIYTASISKAAEADQMQVPHLKPMQEGQWPARNHH